MRFPDSSNGVDVLSLAQATERYPDYEIYTTQIYDSLLDVREDLLRQGIPPERIKTPNFVYKKSCPKLISGEVHIMYDGITSCCYARKKNGASKPLPKGVTYDPCDVRGTLTRFMQRKNEMETSGECDDCILFEDKESFYPSRSQYTMLSMSISYWKCPLHCSYCHHTHYHSSEEEDLRSMQMLVNLAEEMFHSGIADPNFCIRLATGEITDHKYKNLIYDWLEKNKRPLRVLTNGLQFDQKLFELIQIPGSYLNVSLDAGTPETYREIKGADAFDLVVKNLIKYAQGERRVLLKYIFLENNLDEANINGFVAVAQKCNPLGIVISTNMDFQDQSVGYPMGMIDAIVRMIQNLRAIGIGSGSIFINNLFTVEQMDTINDALCNEVLV
jgi:sulfatase maturation enzyme AslB (radical SAM superfamily)